MFEDLKQTWRHLRHAEPGQRFKEYHHEHQAKRRGKWRGVVSITIGIVIVAVGLIALPAPGPGMLVIAIGAALIARESMIVARFLDWAELKLRALLRWAMAAWKRASPVTRVALGLLGVGLMGAAAYFAYAVTLGA